MFFLAKLAGLVAVAGWVAIRINSAAERARLGRESAGARDLMLEHAVVALRIAADAVQASSAGRHDEARRAMADAGRFLDGAKVAAQQAQAIEAEAERLHYLTADAKLAERLIDWHARLGPVAQAVAVGLAGSLPVAALVVLASLL